MAIGIGETLRAARREQGLSLSDAADATRIRERYLAALEDDDFEVLGEDVYVRGFLRNYARYLDLDPGPLLSEYRATFQAPSEDTPVATAPAVRQGVALPPAVHTVAAAGLLVLLLAVVAVAGDRGGTLDEPPAPVPTTPAETGAAQTPRQATAPPTVATSAPAPAPSATAETPGATARPAPTGGVEVVVRISGAPCWVRVVIDGVTELETTLSDGDSRTFRGGESVALRLGDAGNAHLTVDGEDLGRAGGAGEVVDLEFTPDR